MHYEIVEVIGNTSLLDSQQRQHPYRTANGRPLARGIYVVRSSFQLEPARYERSTTYYGPFSSWMAAGEFVRDHPHRSEPIVSVPGIVEVRDASPRLPDEPVRDFRDAVRRLVELGWMRWR